MAVHYQSNALHAVLADRVGEIEIVDSIEIPTYADRPRKPDRCVREPSVWIMMCKYGSDAASIQRSFDCGGDRHGAD
jgi:hypothetical protein